MKMKPAKMMLREQRAMSVGHAKKSAVSACVTVRIAGLADTALARFVRRGWVRKQPWSLARRRSDANC